MVYSDIPNEDPGGKAKNLFRLKKLGLNVPAFCVIPSSVLQPSLNQVKDPLIAIDHFKFPEQWKSELNSIFATPQTTWFAVRSSGAAEDGVSHSFAGQFSTRLYVSFDELENAIREVWKSAFSKHIIIYAQTKGIAAPQAISVIIQEMVPAEVAGVAFGIHPVTGKKNEKVISAVFGLGEGIVSGELVADNYILNEKKEITVQLSEKTHALVHEGNGVITKHELTQTQKNAVTLGDKMILSIGEILNRLQKEFQSPQDIEFAVYKDQLFLLQTRPVTATAKSSQGEYILWDNSNIIESYPGVTTPLTFSFISSSYEGAYRLFTGYLGVDEKTIQKNSNVFANTLGLINGRVYYNLKSWYLMLAMLPGYSINARYMEKMMGVKERFDVPQEYGISKFKAWRRLFIVVFKMLQRYYSITRKRKAFIQLLNATIAEYKSINYDQKSLDELVTLYLNFERKLLNEWKAPLVNDFFAMIAFGSLQKKCTKLGLNKNNPNIHNDLLCGSSDIISTQPIHRTIEIAGYINANTELKQWFLQSDAGNVWLALKSGKYPELKEKIQNYIHDFGERCIGELKLETISYTQEPAVFVKVLQSYVEGNITQKSVSGNIEEQLRTNAEKLVRNKLKFRPWKYYRFKKTLNNARELVSNRENLRYERTRAFGIVREIFSHVGIRLSQNGIIEHHRDVFYLTKDEIIAFAQGRAVTTDFKGLVALRKQEFEQYKDMPPPVERFATYGAVYHENDFYATGKVEKIEGDLKGIGCCPGRVKAKVRVVTNPEEIHSLEGDILVTSSTDPGWVTLFPTASAIVVERGSLLSHSAIVSREMGIPCIVGVTGLLKTLRTGDVIEIDGSTGEIKIIS